MQLVKRWYEPRRFSLTGPERDLLPWKVSVDGRAVLVSRRTLFNRLARRIWFGYRHLKGW